MHIAQSTIILAITSWATAVLAGSTPGSQKPFVLTDKATAKDIYQVKDCKGFKVDELNKTLNAEACAGFRAGCLNQFDITNLKGECLNKIREEELTKLDSDRIKQIANSNVLNLHLTGKTFRPLVKKLKVEELPPIFVSYITRSRELASALLDSNDLSIISGFMTADNVSKLDLSLFRRFGKEMIGKLSYDAFSLVDAYQISSIPNGSFAGFTEEQIEKIPPTAFSRITREQAEQLSDRAWSKISPAQAKLFGPVTKPPPVTAKKDDKDQGGAFAAQVLDRATFLRNHPCQVVKTKVTTEANEKNTLLNADTKKAFDETCKSIWTADENRATKLQSAFGLTLGTIILAIIMV